MQVEFQVGVSHHSKMLRAVNIRPKFAFIRGNIDSIKEQVRRLDKGLPGCALIGGTTVVQQLTLSSSPSMLVTNLFTSSLDSLHM